MIRRRAYVALCIGLAAISQTSQATAESPATKRACADAYEQSQRLRKEHKLVAARAELLVCSRSECPGWVRRDCKPWLEEVDAAVPSIAVVARGVGSVPPSGVRVSVDGASPAPLTAEPIPLDPGEHLLVFDAAGAERLERRITLREGERDRPIHVTLAPTTSTRSDPPAPRADLAEASRPVPALVYVLGGVGLAGLGVGSYFQIAGMSARSDLSECSPRCGQSEVDDARTNLWVGNITLGVSAAALGAAAILYFTRPAVVGSATGLRVGSHALPGGMSAFVAMDY